MIRHRQLMSDPGILKGPGDFSPDDPKEPPKGYKLCIWCEGTGEYHGFFCSDCHGKGIVKKCKACDGEGVDQNNGDGEDCKRCDGTGEEPDGR